MSRRGPIGWPSTLLTAGALAAIVVAAAIFGQRAREPASTASVSPDPSALAGGSQIAASAPATSSPATPAPTSIQLLYSCGGPSFSPSLFEESPLDLQSLPPGVALATFIDSGHDEEHTLPRRGDWHLAGQRDGHAAFVAAVPGDPPYVYALVDLENGEWGVTGWGHCRPTVGIEGTGAATWILGSEEFDPTTTDFVATVTEMACASGRSSDGRVNEPIILYGPDAVIVTFTVVPLPGAQECPGNPPTKVPVHLLEPLGDRRLLDGGIYPWGDPTEPGPWH